VYQRPAYHASVDGQPSLVFQLLDGLQQKFTVALVAELNIDLQILSDAQFCMEGSRLILSHPQLVAGLIVKLERSHVLDVLGVHPVNVDVHFTQLASGDSRTLRARVLQVHTLFL
jgi:hypothetical protein